jgi:mannose-1-phosphate guanylyltransferase
LVESQGIGQLELKVMLDAASMAPAEQAAMAGSNGVKVLVERDPFEYRGTGGVLHDVARVLGDDDYLVVSSGAQLLVEPLKDAVEALAARGADVGILGHRDGTPSGLMLLRCGVLREIATMGFVDLKEQALPAIARKHKVLVEHREAVSQTVRTTRDYLTALRQDHRRQRGEAPSPDPFAEDWHSEFTVVEEGAVVGVRARLFDSVVLAGGRVGAGAVLVRSIVCGGGVVKAGERLVDQLVGPKHGVRAKGGER